MIFTALILASLLVLYSLLIFRITSAWKFQVSHTISVTNEPHYQPVSVIIPARNEASGIGLTIEAVLSQRYPSELFEIIVVDDHSTDGTADIVSKYGSRLSLLRLSETSKTGGSKKEALSYAISIASHPLIATIDADCIPASSEWLQTTVDYLIHDNHNAVTGLVRYRSDGSIWQNTIAMDNAGMMMVTAFGYQAGWFQMANGANLCFRKEIFNEINGYGGNESIASGDDMFLFEKIEIQYPCTTAFVADSCAMVQTLPPEGGLAWLRQRIRWGTKNRKMKNFKLKLTLAFVFLANLALVVAPFMLIGLNMIGQTVLLATIFLKVIADYRLLRQGTTYLGQGTVMKSYLISAMLYPVMLIVSGLLSLTITEYTWKGRRTK